MTSSRQSATLPAVRRGTTQTGAAGAIGTTGAKRTTIGAAVTMAFCGLFAKPAHADTFIFEGPSTVLETRSHALLFRAGRTNTVVEAVEFDRTPERVVWFKAFPSRPSIASSDFSFDTLFDRTRVEPPYQEALREDLFGPSILSVVVARLGRHHRTRGEPAPTTDAVRERLTILDTAVFEGRIHSSTVTRDFEFPDAMQRWLSDLSLRPDRMTAANLAATLNRGWPLVGVVAVPSKQTEIRGRSQLGPLRFEFSSDRPVFPLGRRLAGYGARPKFDLTVVADRTLVPVAYGTTWDQTPWDRSDHRSREFFAIYQRPVHEEEDLTGMLESILKRPEIENAHLIRSAFIPEQEVLGEIPLTEAPRVLDIPDSGRRGSVRDLLMCFILGLAPLVYTPESWFLVWLGSRARARLRRGESAFEHKLWPIFSLIVGAYWFFTLEGPSRIAAIVPVVLGVVLLLVPYTDRDPVRVRSTFKRKRT